MRIYMLYSIILVNRSESLIILELVYHVMEYYDTVAAGYDELYKEEQLKKYMLISTHLEITNEERILDVGCGMGFSGGIFKGKITGIDASRKMLTQKGDSVTESHDKVQGIAEFLPFKDGSFDAVICVTAIHNFKDTKIALEEIKRVGGSKGAITILRKAKYAIPIRSTVEEMFDIVKIIEEEKDTILFYESF